MRGQTLTSAVLIMCLLVSSCTSPKVVQISDNITSDIHAGERVRIVTKDGRNVEFKVVSVTSEDVTGDIKKSSASVMLLNWRSRKYVY